MAVSVHLPASLRAMYGLKAPVIRVEGRTVGEVIAALERLQPGLFDRLCEADGSIREHINIFVGEKNARLDGGPQLEIAPEEEVWIIRAVSGGCASPGAPAAASHGGCA